MSSIAITTPIFNLQILDSWNQLTDEEKLYVYHLNQHVWSTFPIAIKQRSIESFDIFVAILKTFKTITFSELLSKSTVSEEAKTHFENYISMFLSNSGNYRSFGDIKFVPGCSKAEFAEIVSGCGKNYFESIMDVMYDDSQDLKLLAFQPKGYTTYYSRNITKEEVDHVNELLTKKGMMLENTIIEKKENKLIVHIASILEKEEEYEDIILKWGLYKEELEKGIEPLKEVLKLDIVKNNEKKREMFEYLIEAYSTDYRKHKEHQRSWVYDRKPSVEFISGFIETYLDPFGVRGEWESFVAIVNKEKSRTLEELVKHSAEIIETYPWGKEFEKEEFESPDFTSIDIVGYGVSGFAIGINLPNYDDVRAEQTKNVSLGNVMLSRSRASYVPFIPENQQEFYQKYSGKGVEANVAIHELLGHGSGKLLIEKNGKKNFPENLINPITGKPVTYYKENETWLTVFQGLANPAEELRAEAASLYLVYNQKVAEILGLSEEHQYVTWLNMMRQGFIGLEYYNPEAKKWGQSHSQARFALWKVCENCGAVKFENETIVLEKEKIPIAIEALKELLKTIQICRATADVETMKNYFIPLSTPEEKHLKYRDLIIQKKCARNGFVQCNTKLVNGKVELVEYESSVQGMIQSFLDRFDY